MKKILDWLTGNFNDLIDFFKSHCIEINIQKKETLEVKRSIKINNLFMCLLVLFFLIIIVCFD